jgi:hypothetical protein
VAILYKIYFSESRYFGSFTFQLLKTANDFTDFGVKSDKDQVLTFKGECKRRFTCNGNLD